MTENLHQYSATSTATGKLTVGMVLLKLIRHPSYFLLRRWNWKSAILSCLVRGSIFFVVNSASGFAAATSAMLLEISFLSITAGFYGALLQTFRKAKPDWAASLTVMILLPALHHLLEFFIHWFGGTKKLSTSMVASITFSALSACFNLFTMRRGVLIIGKHQQPFLQDLMQLPGVILAFLLFIPKALQRFFTNPVMKTQAPQNSQGAIFEPGEIPKSVDSISQS